MGWFDEQIKQRIQSDDEAFEGAFASMAGVIMGKKFTAAFSTEREKTKTAVDEILKYYHIKSVELPEEIIEMNEQLEFLMRPCGVMRRMVYLEGEWYKDAMGPYLGTLKSDGAVVALIPQGISGYTFFDHQSGKTVKLNKKTAAMLDEEAICFYKPLPVGKVGIKELLVFIAQALSMADYLMVAAASLAMVLFGMVLPIVNKLLFSHVVYSQSLTLLVSTGVMMVCAVISAQFATAIKQMVLARIKSKTDMAMQAASMMRVLSLPASFFKDFSSGELSSRVQSINILCTMLCEALLGTGLASLCSLLYITQIFAYAPSLVVPALAIILGTFVFTLLSTFAYMRMRKNMLEASNKEAGMTFALISGVQKLKLSGAEKRAFAKWAAVYKNKANATYNPPGFIKINSAIMVAIHLIGLIVLYYQAVKTGVSVADYYAFNAAYAVMSAAFLSLAAVAQILANVKPIYENVRPVLDAVPEVATGKKVLTKISGGVEMNNVSFRYTPDGPLILDDLSVKIKPGQYVAIVGRTGCGKSTLMRLLLGFETAQKGAVYYDGKDINSVDLRSLRRKIGVVMQNGKLFQGDVFANITISAPWLSMDEAWEAAEMAGMAEDIRKMPMGMNTVISEGSGGVSGGQRQRLMIARAIAPKPKLLMFDEATSALDNLTQKRVSESLNGLKCTRIVIAHRLSTIKECDRIIVLEKGRIIEDGNYEELVNRGGYFSELVARQRLDDDAFVGKTTLF